MKQYEDCNGTGIGILIKELKKIKVWIGIRLLIEIKFNSKNLKFESGNKELKYCREAGTLFFFFFEINIEYNSFKVNFTKLRSK